MGLYIMSLGPMYCAVSDNDIGGRNGVKCENGAPAPAMLHVDFSDCPDAKVRTQQVTTSLAFNRHPL